MKLANRNKILFHYSDVRFSFPHRTQLKTFLGDQFKKHCRIVEAINYVFCTDEHLLSINQQYLNHDTLTDIITFELSDPSQPLLSDIYISIPRVRDNAIQFDHSFSQELHRVIFHGALHLLGFGDKSVEQKNLMRENEERLIEEYFVSRATVSGRNTTN